MTLRSPSCMTQSTLVKTCRHNLQTALLAQMGAVECRTWKQLVLQGKQAEEIVARVRAEEKDSKARPDKPTQRTPESSSQPKRRDTLATEVKSPSKPQSVGGVELPAKHVPINYTPSRMSTWSLYSSYSKRVTNSNCQRPDVLKKWGKQMILTTVYITRCWDTLPRIATSLKMFFRL